MRFLADENLEHPIVEALRGQGHEVATIPGHAAGLSDTKVLARAVEEDRVLVTNDKDFAELAFFQQKAASGIILIRLPRFRSLDKATRVLEVVEEQGERLTGALTVIEEEAMRRRAFPWLPRT